MGDPRPNSLKFNKRSGHNSKWFSSDLDATRKLKKVTVAEVLKLRLYKEYGSQSMLQIFKLLSLRTIIISNYSQGEAQILNFLSSLRKLYDNYKKIKDFKKIKLVQLYINKQEWKGRSRNGHLKIRKSTTFLSVIVICQATFSEKIVTIPNTLNKSPKSRLTKKCFLMVQISELDTNDTQTESFKQVKEFQALANREIVKSLEPNLINKLEWQQVLSSDNRACSSNMAAEIVTTKIQSISSRMKTCRTGVIACRKQRLLKLIMKPIGYQRRIKFLIISSKSKVRMEKKIALSK